MHFMQRVLFITLILNFSCTENNDIESSYAKESVNLNRQAKNGRHIFPDGSIYEGELVMGKPNGYGVHELANGDAFEGQHKDGLAHGHGTRRYKSNPEIVQYVGNWKSGKRDGFGTLILSDSSRMVGDWENDYFHFGEFLGSNGLVMTGKWEKEFLEEGFVRSVDGTEFTGEFMNDGSFKQGTYLDVNGDRYTGYFKNNNFHGFGILRKKNGTLYTGTFKDGVYSSYGILRESDDSVYSGEFKNGLPNGKESRKICQELSIQALGRMEKKKVWDLWISETELVLLESSKMV